MRYNKRYRKDTRAVSVTYSYARKYHDNPLPACHITKHCKQARCEAVSHVVHIITVHIIGHHHCNWTLNNIFVLLALSTKRSQIPSTRCHQAMCCHSPNIIECSGMFIKARIARVLSQDPKRGPLWLLLCKAPILEDSS